jgi:DNA polymerase-3 subunit beta
MLQNLSSDEITLALSTPSRAGILKPAVKEENEDVLMLVMPLMINN